MKREVQLRVTQAARHILKTGATVRACADVFGVSKTTIHKDVTDRLQRLDPHLAEQVRDVLDLNKAERHIRGGLATKEKYLQQSGRSAR